MCLIEVFKMLVVNLLQSYLGTTGVYIVFVMHMLSGVLYLSMVFFMKVLLKRSLIVNKLAIFLCYSCSFVSLIVETQLIIL